MEANELMIGDWVYLIKDYGKPVKDVLKISALDLYRIEDGMLEVEPIPLTPEILEKNGFTEIKGAYPTFKIDIYGYLIKVTFPKENKETNNGNPFLVIDSRPSYYSSECLYVHELQHVLKLLGIKKEIIL
jgi:hypothetical protein